MMVCASLMIFNFEVFVIGYFLSKQELMKWQNKPTPIKKQQACCIEVPGFDSPADRLFVKQNGQPQKRLIQKAAL